MKKITALLVAAVLMLALSGCTVELLGDWGGSKAGDSTSEATVENVSEPEDPDPDEPEDPDKPENGDVSEAGSEETDPGEDGESEETGGETAESAEENPEEDSQEDSQEESEEEPDGPSEEEVYAAFAAVIDELVDQCGEGEIREPQEEEDQEMLWGVAVVRLIDMNKDGVPELYVACGEPGYVYLNRQYLYVYYEGSAVQALRAMITNDGTEIAPCSMIVDKEDAVYLGIGAPFNLDGKYITVDLDEEELIRTDVEYTAGYMSDDNKFIYNGEELTMNVFEARQDEFLADAEITKICYLEMTEDEMNAVLETTGETIAQIRGE